MRRFSLTLSIALIVTAAALAVATWSGGGVRSRVPASAGVDVQVLGRYGTLPPFSLVERSGRRVTADDLRGVVSIIDLIYTDCTDTCPMQTLAMARLEQDFHEVSDLRLVSVSVDPEHDTPDVLRRYAERHGARDRWWFLTGPASEVHCLALEGLRLGVSDARTNEPATCTRLSWLAASQAWAHGPRTKPVMHSTRVALVGRDLVVRAYHDALDPDSMARLRTNVRRLLAERT